MAIVQNDSKHIVDVTGGKSLVPGEQANVDPANPHEAGLIAEGILTIVDPDTPPPPPPVAESLLYGLFDDAEKGDLVFFDGSDWKRLERGSLGQVLQSGDDDTDPSWGPVATRLQDLGDVDASVVTDGKAVIYDATSGKFEGQTPISDLASLSDVDLSDIISGDLLTWDGSRLVRATRVSLGTAPLGFRGDGYIAHGSRQFVSYGGNSNGTHTDLNSKIREVAPSEAQSLRVVFENFGGSAPITVTASLERSDGSAILPLFFDGQPSVQIPVGGYVVSDPAGFRTAKNTAFYVRTHVTIASGQTWKINHVIGETGELVDTSTTDKTLSGTISGTGSGGATWAYGPWMVLAKPAKRLPCVTVVGDSIVNGDNRSTSIYFWRIMAEGQLSVTQCATGGDTFTNWDSDGPAGGSTSGFASMKRFLTAGSTHVIMEHGTNDFQTAGVDVPTVAPKAIRVWKQLADIGVYVYQMTMVPRPASSTDSWATVGNQTVSANQTNRAAWNDWLRDGAPLDPSTKTYVATGTAGALRAGSPGHPLLGIIEAADQVESSRNSGKFKAAYTFDGIHLSDTGHTQLGNWLATQVAALFPNA